MTPFENTLGLNVTARHDDGVTVEFPLDPRFLNSQGVLHGGIIATLADEATWHALHARFGDRAYQSTTTELKVNYLLPITGVKATARATLLRAGRTLCVARVDIFDDRQRLASAALVTFMLLPATA